MTRSRQTPTDWSPSAKPVKVTEGDEPHTLYLFFKTADNETVKRVVRTSPFNAPTGRRPAR